MTKHTANELGYTIVREFGEKNGVAIKKNGKSYLIAEFAGEKGRYFYAPIRCSNRYSANNVLNLMGINDQF